MRCLLIVEPCYRVPFVLQTLHSLDGVAIFVHEAISTHRTSIIELVFPGTEALKPRLRSIIETFGSVKHNSAVAGALPDTPTSSPGPPSPWHIS